MRNDNNEDKSAVWGRLVGRYAWIAGPLLVRMHYIVVAITTPFGWR